MQLVSMHIELVVKCIFHGQEGNRNLKMEEEMVTF